MKGKRQVKTFLSLETWIVYVCHSEGKTKDLSAFEQGMVISARLTSFSVSRTAKPLGFSHQQFPVCIKNGPPFELNLFVLRAKGGATNVLYTQCIYLL
jgi:hypothetical protein